MNQEYQRLLKRYERIFTPRIYRAIKKQVDEYLRQGRLDDVTRDPIIETLERLYSEVGGKWAYKTDQQIRRDLGLPKLRFNERIANIIRQQYGPELLNMSDNITQTTKDHIRTILQNSIKRNLTLEQIRAEIQATGPSEARARVIARTETVRAANAGAMVNANEKGYVLQKKWFSVMDNRTRHDHEKLDGQTVDKDQPFTVVDKNGITQKLMFPGDSSLGATPEQTINCRCSMQFLAKPEAQRKPRAKPAEPKPVEPALVEVKPEKKKPVFLEAKTISEAEKFALDVIGVKYANFKGIDIKVANDINKSIFNIKQVMPNIRTMGIGSAQQANKDLKYEIETAIKKSDYYTKLINLYGQDQADDFAKRFASGQAAKVGGNVIAWSQTKSEIRIPGGTIIDVSKYTGVFVNEKYGKSKSIIDDVVKKNRDKKWFTDSAEDFGYIMVHELGHEIDKSIGFRELPAFIEIFNRENKLGVESVTNKLSKYGATAGGKSSSKPMEMIAEAWAEYMTSENPRPLSKEIGELMLKTYHSKFEATTDFNTWKAEIMKLITQ